MSRRFGNFAVPGFAYVAIVVTMTWLLFGPSRPAGAASVHGSDRTWSGTVSRGSGYTSARGTFVVPKASARCAAGSASVWVGLGGYGSLPFAQNGFTVTQNAVAGWYEVFDRAGNTSTVAVKIVASPGDVVNPRIRFSADHRTLWFAWVNLTRGTRVLRTVTNASRYYNGNSAEWVVERAPYDANVDTPMLAHAAITWNNATVSSSRGTTGAHNAHSVLLDLVNVNTTHVLERVSTHTSTSFTSSFASCR